MASCSATALCGHLRAPGDRKRKPLRVRPRRVAKRTAGRSEARFLHGAAIRAETAGTTVLRPEGPSPAPSGRGPTDFGRQEGTEEAGVEDVLPPHHLVPPERVVRALKDELPHFDEWSLTLASSVEPFLHEPLPAVASSQAPMVVNSGSILRPCLWGAPVHSARL